MQHPDEAKFNSRQTKETPPPPLLLRLLLDSAAAMSLSSFGVFVRNKADKQKRVKQRD